MAIADVAERERCWLHVDAAYGGFFLLTEQGCGAQGIERSDSVVLDPHKGLFLPYGSGIVVVRDAAPLIAGHNYTGSYMQDARADASELSPADVSPELSRHFRALRMWLPLAPPAPPRSERRWRSSCCSRVTSTGRSRARGSRLGPAPDLSVVTYRWAPPGVSLEQANAMNKAIVDGALNDGRVFLSSTMLEGCFTLRMAALAFRTHRRTIDLAVQVLREQVAALEVPA